MLERKVILLNSVYQSFQAKDVPSNSMLMGLIDRVLLPLASHCSPPALSQFFITNIAEIMTTLQTRFTKVSKVVQMFIYAVIYADLCICSEKFKASC